MQLFIKLDFLLQRENEEAIKRRVRKRKLCIYVKIKCALYVMLSLDYGKRGVEEPNKNS